jgi:hypothetical protein
LLVLYTIALRKYSDKVCRSPEDAAKLGEEARKLYYAFIDTLRLKLRNSLAAVNVRAESTLGLFRGIIVEKTADVVAFMGAEPAENPAHLAYGLMYLICRLVENFPAEEAFRGVRKVDFDLFSLVSGAFQTSRFPEIRFKAVCHNCIFVSGRYAYKSDGIILARDPTLGINALWCPGSTNSRPPRPAP